MSNVNNGPSAAVSNNMQAGLQAHISTGVTTFANLPPASRHGPEGTNYQTAWTSDQGLVYSNGTAWVGLATASNTPFNPSAAGLPAGVTANLTNLNASVLAILQQAITPQMYGATGNGTTDDTTAMQAWYADVETNTLGAGYRGFLPQGKYKITSPIVPTKRFASVKGAGKFAAQILFNGVAGGAIVPSAISLWSPEYQDFSIIGDASSGHAIDSSAVTSQVYLASFKNLTTQSGGNAIYAPNCFSTTFDNWRGDSFSGHVFRVNCGPAVSWIGCYAGAAGSGKAGYRLAGGINMVACNGLDSGGYWGIFGNDTGGSDGFQTDFSVTSYPSILLDSCNIEAFTTGGLRIQSALEHFEMRGGGFDRSTLSSAYHSLIRFMGGALNTSPAYISPAYVSLGSGAPTVANGYIYSDTNIGIVDQGNGLSGASINSSYQGSYAGLIAIIRQSFVADVYQGHALRLTAVQLDRATLGTLRYKTPAALTPVGSAQAIDVTGYTRVTVTPAAAASISTATFSASPGTTQDFDRNGDLYIEAGNANLTINHTASGANTFRTNTGANLTPAAGRIYHFMWSTTSTQWIQV